MNEKNILAKTLTAETKEKLNKVFSSWVFEPRGLEFALSVGLGQLTAPEEEETTSFIGELFRAIFVNYMGHTAAKLAAPMVYSHYTELTADQKAKIEADINDIGLYEKHLSDELTKKVLADEAQKRNRHG